MATTQPSYPKKLFYRINEVADIVRVEPYVLRYWESRFPMLKPERFGNDERRYRQGDIELLLRIRSLLYETKYTIAGAIERLKREKAGELSATDTWEEPETEGAEPPVAVADLRASLSGIREELIELRNALA